MVLISRPSFGGSRAGVRTAAGDVCIPMPFPDAICMFCACMHIAGHLGSIV